MTPSTSPHAAASPLTRTGAASRPTRSPHTRSTMPFTSSSSTRRPPPLPPRGILKPSATPWPTAPLPSMDAYSDTEVPRGGRASLAVQAARRKYRRDKLNAIKIQELRDLAAGVNRARGAQGGPSCDADAEDDDDDTASTASDDTLPLSDPTEVHDRAAFLASDETPSLSPLHISDSPVARLGGPLIGGPDRDTQTLATAKRMRPVEFDDHVFDDDDDTRPIIEPPSFMRMLTSMRPNAHPEPARDAKRRRVAAFRPPGPPSDSSDTESGSDMPDLRRPASLLRSPPPPPPPIVPALPPARRGVTFDLASNTVIEFSENAADRMDVDPPPAILRPKDVPAAPTSAPSPPTAVRILTWIRRSYTLPPVTRALSAVAQAMLSPPRKPVTVGSLADGPAQPAHAAGPAAAACLL
ncbi:hypothetical protein GGF31_001437 [Allomyces arbusculus]|nr:hypothetical protein GGF31_001437 [Allomyces arbusculus]